MSDARLLPLFGPLLWFDRKSEREWHYCKYCYEDVPTFILTAGRMGSDVPESQTRCCWQCGAGFERLPEVLHEIYSFE